MVAKCRDELAPLDCVQVLLAENEWNKGFGQAHGEAFEAVPSDVFVMLNNDVFFLAPGWLARLMEPILAQRASFSGLAGAPSVLQRDGHGTLRSTPAHDYIEASAMAIDSAVVRRHGLFSADMRIAYFEDSDLSLRYRQLGLEGERVPLEHSHRRGTSARVLGKALLQAIQERNRARMLSRWGAYLDHRKLHNRIYLELCSAGWGDVLCALPAVLRLREDHPAAHLVVHIRQESLRFLFSSIPGVEVLVQPSRSEAEWEGIRRRHDRAVSFRDLRYTSTQYLGREIATLAGCEFEEWRAQRHLSSLLSESPSTRPSLLPADRSIAILHADYNREHWHGRGVSPLAFRPLARQLQERGFHVVLVGTQSTDADQAALAVVCDQDLRGRTSIEELFALVRSADLFVGIDSGPMHIAQLCGVHSFVVFGATSPVARILRWDCTGVWMRWDLDCLGCYHRLLDHRVENQCVRMDQACIRQIPVRECERALAAFLDRADTGLPMALALSQSIEAVHREIEFRRNETPSGSGTGLPFAGVRQWLKRPERWIRHWYKRQFGEKS